MTDAEYWSIASRLPSSVLQGSVVLDWHSQLPNCPPDPMSCSWVRGYNPIQNCWIDPGAQYATPPSPYPPASSWGVSLCNPPITQPPASGGGTTTPPTGGSGGNYIPTTTQPPITSSNPGFSLNIPTWVYLAGAGLLVFMFLKR